MKRLVLILGVILGMAGLAAAQVTSPTQDVLGAHNVYGRGCIACHAPHSGAAANGRSNASGNSGNLALWGQDLTPLYGQVLKFAGGATVTIPNYGTVSSPKYGTAVGLPSDAGDGTFVITACLSCHDGNVATSGMMKGTTVETVTIQGASFNPPTLLGNDGTTAGNYLNDHPVGPTTNPGCGGAYTWDCTANADGTISFNGKASSQFLTNYYDVVSYGPIGALVKTAGTYTPAFGGGANTNSWVTCTTCHDQHNMSYFNAGPKGIKPTHFFVRGWYDPGNSATSNSAAQFCRTCHGGESNEMHGQMAVTTM